MPRWACEIFFCTTWISHMVRTLHPMVKPNAWSVRPHGPNSICGPLFQNFRPKCTRNPRFLKPPPFWGFGPENSKKGAAWETGGGRVSQTTPFLKLSAPETPKKGWFEKLAGFEPCTDVLWDFLDGFTVLACKNARSGDWWLSRAQRAKKAFQEIQGYLESGKVVLPGFGRQGQGPVAAPEPCEGSWLGWEPRESQLGAASTVLWREPSPESFQLQMAGRHHEGKTGPKVASVQPTWRTRRRWRAACRARGSLANGDLGNGSICAVGHPHLPSRVHPKFRSSRFDDAGHGLWQLLLCIASSLGRLTSGQNRTNECQLPISITFERAGWACYLFLLKLWPSYLL